MAVELEWLESIKQSLKSIDHECGLSKSISLVPEALQKWNKDAYYKPRVVSIGPRFIGSRDSLHFMEEDKNTCMFSLLHRAGNEGEAGKYLQACGEIIDKLDDLVRESYVADISNVEKSELAKIMLVDGCFLLELLISKELDSHLPTRLRPNGRAAEILEDEIILSDLLLLENQIPIVVLHRLSQTLFPDLFSSDEKGNNIINRLVLSVFRYSFPPTLHFKERPPHILDIVHLFVNGKGVVDSPPCDDVMMDLDTIGDHVVVDTIDDTTTQTQTQTQLHNYKLNRCALRLLTAGVTIKAILPNCEGSSTGMLFRLRNIFLISLMNNQHLEQSMEIKGLEFNFMFENGKLEIEQLHITKNTRAIWCNIIAWEHCRSISTRSQGENGGGKFTWAALMFNGLICSEDDVQLLKDKKIIVDHLKMSNQQLMLFFRKIASGVDHKVVDSRSYIQMVHDINNFHMGFFIIISLWVVRFMNQNYNFVATVVSLLTVVQTVFAILAYYYRN